MYFSVSVASGEAAPTPPNIAKPNDRRVTFKKNTCLTKIPRELKNSTLKKLFFLTEISDLQAREERTSWEIVKKKKKKRLTYLP